MEENQLQQKFGERFVLPAAGKPPGEHQWTSGSDVQSLWRRFGWTPPSEQKTRIKKPVDTTQHPPLRIVRG